ncbi:MAG TPA: hypothetical protein VFG30_04020 [Polyangiales bacterium]|nr:hypothetical protein [Polyangiales bacterium]
MNDGRSGGLGGGLGGSGFFVGSRLMSGCMMISLSLTLTDLLGGCG